MRDLYLFDKKTSDTVDVLDYLDMKHNSRAIGIESTISGFDPSITMPHTGDSWFSRRGIKLKRKLPV